MDDKNVKIVLTATDKTGGALKSTQANIDQLDKKAGFLTGTFGKLAFAAGTALTAVAAAGITMGVRVAATLETAQVGLETLLGSSEKAAATIERLKKEAARTPFELPGLAQATQLLTSVTHDGDKSIDILLNVGEGLAAMGKGQPELDRIIVNLQQIAAVGKAATIDIKQFAFAGIPIYEMLAEVTGKTGQALGDFIEEGGVTFDLLTKMFDNANNEGGRFFNAFVNQSGTFNQALSNMKDSLGIFFADFVTNTGIFQGLTNAMIVASNTLGNYKQVIEDTKAKLSELMSTLDEHTGLVTAIKDAWEPVIAVFREQLIPLFQDIWERHGPLLTEFGKQLAIVFGATLVGAIYILSGALAALLMGLQTILAFGATLVDALLITWTAAIDTFTAAWNKAASAIERVISIMNRAKSIASDIGGKIGDIITGGRAAGGPVSGGSSYLVGERGPEIFSPKVAGNIIPNHRLAGAGGITINISGNTLLDEFAGQKISEQIMRSLKSNLRL